MRLTLSTGETFTSIGPTFAVGQQIVNAIAALPVRNTKELPAVAEHSDIPDWLSEDE